MWQPDTNFFPFKVTKIYNVQVGWDRENLLHIDVLHEELKSSWGMLFVVHGNSSEFSEVASNFPYELCTFFAIL